MTPKRAPSPLPERPGVLAVAVYVLTHGWDVFIADWNWKTALLSAIYRLGAWPLSKLAGATLLTPGALRGAAIEFLFRLAIGGFWGSLLQAFAKAQPAWLASAWMMVILPGISHALEYLVLRAGGATHAGALTFASICMSMLSVLVNLAFMRKGIFVTGRGAASLGADLRRIFGGIARLARRHSGSKGNT